MSTLHGVNSLHTAVDWEAGVPGLHIDISSNGCCMQLNGIFQKSGIGQMLKGKDCCALNMIFPTIEPISMVRQGFKIMQI